MSLRSPVGERAAHASLRSPVGERAAHASLRSPVGERAARRARLRELTEEAGAQALLLRRPANFAWYTGGGNSRVDYARADGVADVVLTEDGEYVLTSTVEAPRMREEETPALTVVEYPWEEGPAAALAELVGGASLVADVPLDGAGLVAEPLDALRWVLDGASIDRLRGVGADLHAALGEAAAGLTSGMSEHELAAAIAFSCRTRGLVPTVVLAATDERVARHRHALPRGAPIRRRAMLAASALRGGLFANLTRMAWLEEPEPEDVRRQAACEEILLCTRKVSLPGRTLAEVFTDVRGFYAEAGFPDEWRLHHQGGTTGYASRELVATPHTHQEIQTGMAFSWNPSVTGAKAEETFVLGETGLEVVSSASLAAGS